METNLSARKFGLFNIRSTESMMDRLKESQKEANDKAETMFRLVQREKENNPMIYLSLRSLFSHLRMSERKVTDEINFIDYLMNPKNKDWWINDCNQFLAIHGEHGSILILLWDEDSQRYCSQFGGIEITKRNDRIL